MRVFEERAYTRSQIELMGKEHPITVENEDLYNDLFTDLFEWRPSTTGEHSFVLEKVRKSEDFRELKESTLGSSVFSHLSAVEMTNEACKEVKRISKEDPFADLPTELADQLKDWSMEQAFQRGIQSATEQVESIMELAENSGCGSEDGAGSRVTLDDKLHAAERLQSSKKLRDVVRELGRWKLALRTVKSVAQKGLTPVSVTIGSDIASMLPSESVLLAIPQLRPLWSIKFLESKLLQYDREEPEEDKEGPLVVLLDQSGSMFGNPDTVAKGLVLALSAQMAKDKRPLVCIPFSTKIAPRSSWFDSRNGKSLFDFVENFMDGGTNFQEPLLDAIDFIWEDLHEADILMLTDGYAAIYDMDRVKNELEGGGIKLTSILIGMEPDSGQLRSLGRCVAVGSLLQREDVLKGVL